MPPQINPSRPLNHTEITERLILENITYNNKLTKVISEADLRALIEQDFPDHEYGGTNGQEMAIKLLIGDSKNPPKYRIVAARHENGLGMAAFIDQTTEKLLVCYDGTHLTEEPAADLLGNITVNFGLGPVFQGGPAGEFLREVTTLTGRKGEVVGHSLGGANAVQAAQENPELVERVTTFASLGKYGPFGAVASVFNDVFGIKLTSADPYGVVNLVTTPDIAPKVGISAGTKIPVGEYTDVPATSVLGAHRVFHFYEFFHTLNPKVQQWQRIFGEDANIVYLADGTIAGEVRIEGTTFYITPDGRDVAGGIGLSLSVARERVPNFPSDINDSDLFGTAPRLSNAGAGRAAVHVPPSLVANDINAVISPAQAELLEATTSIVDQPDGGRSTRVQGLYRRADGSIVAVTLEARVDALGRLVGTAETTFTELGADGQPNGVQATISVGAGVDGAAEARTQVFRPGAGGMVETTSVMVADDAGRPYSATIREFPDGTAESEVQGSLGADHTVTATLKLNADGEVIGISGLKLDGAPLGATAVKALEAAGVDPRALLSGGFDTVRDSLGAQADGLDAYFDGGGIRIDRIETAAGGAMAFSGQDAGGHGIRIDILDTAVNGAPAQGGGGASFKVTREFDGTRVILVYDLDQNGNYSLVRDRIALEDTDPSDGGIGRTSQFASFGASLGGTLGSSLGRLVSDNPFVSTAASAILGAIGTSLGRGIEAGLHTGDLSLELAKSFETFGASLQQAGISGFSALLVGELAEALGLDGVPGAVLGYVATPLVAQIVGNLANGAEALSGLGNAINGAFTPASLGNFVGSFLLSKVLPATSEVGAVLGAVGGFIGQALIPIPVVGSLIGQAIGTFLGNLFGGSKKPTAEAEIGFRDESFEVVAVTSKQGGNRKLATDLGESVANTLDQILELVGGRVANIDTRYDVGVGHRKGAYFFSIDDRRIFVDSPMKAVESAVFALIDKVEIEGGDPHIRRALYNSTATTMIELFADLQIAADYSLYLENLEVINALIAADPTSAFAAGWIATLARAAELRLAEDHASDRFNRLSHLIHKFDLAGLDLTVANYLEGLGPLPKGTVVDGRFRFEDARFNDLRFWQQAMGGDAAAAQAALLAFAAAALALGPDVASATPVSDLFRQGGGQLDTPFGVITVSRDGELLLQGRVVADLLAPPRLAGDAGTLFLGVEAFAGSDPTPTIPPPAAQPPLRLEDLVLPPQQPAGPISFQPPPSPPPDAAPPAVITLEPPPINLAPTAVADTLRTPEDTALVLGLADLLGNDRDPEVAGASPAQPVLLVSF